MVDLFSAQMFLFGVVHCDPHPGNIFVRRLPNGKPELVLIDHGLYIRMSPQFKRQYAEFWKALITFDNATIKAIVNSWGVDSPDIFASATLMRPYSGGDGSTKSALRDMHDSTTSNGDSNGNSRDNGNGNGNSNGNATGSPPAPPKTEQQRAYEMQLRFRQSVAQILGDGTQWPKELLFIGRNLRIVQGNNQFLGSPVNRIKITGTWASRALAEDTNLSGVQRLLKYGNHLLFRFMLSLSDVLWWTARVRQIFGRGGGMEDEIEEGMRRMARGLGVELNHGVFEG